MFVVAWDDRVLGPINSETAANLVAEKQRREGEDVGRVLPLQEPKKAAPFKLPKHAPMFGDCRKSLQPDNLFVWRQPAGVVGATVLFPQEEAPIGARVHVVFHEGSAAGQVSLCGLPPSPIVEDVAKFDLWEMIEVLEQLEPGTHPTLMVNGEEWVWHTSY